VCVAQVEAELSLSFEQLIYHLAEDIFGYYKTRASHVIITKDYQYNFQLVSVWFLATQHTDRQNTHKTHVRLHARLHIFRLNIHTYMHAHAHWRSQLKPKALKIRNGRYATLMQQRWVCLPV
jgi:hypothetical protein